MTLDVEDRPIVGLRLLRRSAPFLPFLTAAIIGRASLHLVRRLLKEWAPRSRRDKQKQALEPSRKQARPVCSLARLVIPTPERVIEPFAVLMGHGHMHERAGRNAARSAKRRRRAQFLAVKTTTFRT